MSLIKRRWTIRRCPVCGLGSTSAFCYGEPDAPHNRAQLEAVVVVPEQQLQGAVEAAESGARLAEAMLLALNTARNRELWREEVEGLRAHVNALRGQ